MTAVGEWRMESSGIYRQWVGHIARENCPPGDFQHICGLNKEATGRLSNDRSQRRRDGAEGTRARVMMGASGG